MHISPVNLNVFKTRQNYQNAGNNTFIRGNTFSFTSKADTFELNASSNPLKSDRASDNAEKNYAFVFIMNLEDAEIRAKNNPDEFRASILSSDENNKNFLHHIAWNKDAVEKFAQLAPDEFKILMLLQDNQGKTPLHCCLQEDSREVMRKYAPKEYILASCTIDNSGEYPKFI